MFIDSHCHLDRIDIDAVSLSDIVQNAEASNVERMLCVSVGREDFYPMRDAVAQFNSVFISCGVHPLHMDDAFTPEELTQLCQQPEVVAIGETGLDYYYTQDDKPRQQESFRRHIDIANATGKPLIVHTRDARADTIGILREQLSAGTGGVLHCFTESLDMAEQAIELGFYISFSGIITFNSAKELQQTAKSLPLERLLIETDSPWLAPVPYRGKTNQPKHVVEVAKFLAELKGISVEEVAETTTDNFYRLFSKVPRA